ncbi:MAG: UDP-N-acetylglucosamine 4,6-dehydratase (inverting) [Bacteroidales bacterium]|nr:UDP-N-acetylglucosamine 4,6-dehydratase (inverting) [Bacteroidales bacterium]MCF8405473.1 UDP-N-acetylglucosamine 4,6-dehydratase (inverting) [Bacteroidales bacterium]
MLNKKSVLITGGTGSFGKKFTEVILKRYPQIERLVIFSRDELKQFEMAQQFPREKYPMIRFFIGDVRDEARLARATEGIEVIIHAAALKQVPAAEYNPDEFIKTNIGGAQNVVNAALSKNVKVVVALSTDKAAAPINLYGATKLVSDKLFISANNIKGARDLRFCAVRYGNVMGSRGSVIPFFLEKAKEGELPVTHKDMTRFNISLEDGVDMVLWAIENAMGGEIFVPKIPSYSIGTLAEAIAPNAKINYVGIRAGEKLHEEMITDSDSYNTIDLGKYYAILPMGGKKEKFLNYHKGSKLVEPGFRYNSGTNEENLSVEEIRNLIREHIDPDFNPL